MDAAIDYGLEQQRLIFYISIITISMVASYFGAADTYLVRTDNFAVAECCLFAAVDENYLVVVDFDKDFVDAGWNNLALAKERMPAVLIYRVECSTGKRLARPR